MTNEFEENDGMVDGADASDALGSVDFDVEDEYKPDPLIPKGTYHGVVTDTKFDAKQFCIVWDICLHDNGGYCNDGSTPIDGQHVYYRNWLPKPGDENLMIKSGKTNKRQSKINMLKDFEVKLGIDMGTPAKIAAGLQEKAWIGIELDVDVVLDEYEGRVRNTASKVAKSSMY